MATAIATTATIIYASFFFWYAKGQIPGPCAVNATGSIKRCCPDLCGANQQPPRGECVDISELVEGFELDSSTFTDPRRDWPHFFNDLCKCNGNYFGYDCGECKFGYRGENCDEPHMRRRRSITRFTPEEREEYLDALKKAKSDTTYDRYMAIAADGPPPEIVQVPLYDLFVWMHFYVGRENDRLADSQQYPDARDYGHESGAFLTWHRLYLLWFEREIQHLTGNADFSLPYWDWSEESNREFLFDDEWLGSREDGGRVGGFFGNELNWKTVCWHGRNGSDTTPDDPCDPRMSTGPLHRCPVTAFCDKTDERWPDQNEINSAVAATLYDREPYSRYSTNSFRNLLEGFEIVNDCNDQVLCSGGIRRRLHNSVHLILGIGDFDQIPNLNQFGTMGDVAGSPNDPIFINHHCMIDYIFEKWLQENSGVPYAPTIDEPEAVNKTGHRAEDVIVPFIPLYTNEQLLKQASEFGYEFEEPGNSSTSLSKGKIAKIVTGWVAGLILLLLMA